MGRRIVRLVVVLPLVAAVLSAVGASGCGPPVPRLAPPLVPPDPRPPAADVARMRFDPATRAIHLYELPAGGRWWLIDPADPPSRREIPAESCLPDGIDPATAEVEYTLPGFGPPSIAVPLRHLAPDR